jgi:hypothetical protein
MGWLDDLAAGGYSALDSALFGLPGWVVGNVAGSENVKKFEEWKKEHEEAGKIGDIVGTVGSLLLPGGAITKGLGKGLGLLGRGAEALKLGKLASGIGKGVKALDTVGDVIKGTKTLGATGGKLVGLGGKALRGALGAAETALPRALFGGAEGLPESIAAGAVLGPLGGWLGGKLGKGITKLKGMAQNAGLKGLGVTEGMLGKGGSFGKASRAVAGKAGGVEDLKDLTLKMAGKEGMSGVDDMVAYSMRPNGPWMRVAEGYNAAPAAIKMQEMAQLPALRKIAEEFGEEGEKVVAKLLQDVGKRGDYNAVKDHLWDLVKRAGRGGMDDVTIATGRAAREMAEAVDDIAAKLTPDVDLDLLKKEYPFKKLADEVRFKDAKSLETPFAQGSPTSEKGLMTKLLGGGAGAAVGGFDPADPSTWGKAAIAGIGGSLGGAALSKYLPRLANKAMSGIGDLAGKVTSKLPIDKLDVLAPKAAGILGMGGEPTGGAAIAGGAGAGGTEASTATAEAAIDEAAPTPEAAQAIKDEAAKETNIKFLSTIKEKLFTDWQLDGWAASGIPFEDFAAEVERVTNGFDPKKSAKVLFKDKAEREDYLKQYEIALQYKSLGEGGGIEAALGYEGATNPMLAGVKDVMAGIGAGEEDFLARKQKFGALADLLANLETKDTTGQARAFTMKKVEDDIADIARMKGPMEDKIKLLEKKLVQSGFTDLPTLREWGLI